MFFVIVIAGSVAVEPRGRTQPYHTFSIESAAPDFEMMILGDAQKTDPIDQKLWFFSEGGFVNSCGRVYTDTFIDWVYYGCPYSDQPAECSVHEPASNHVDTIVSLTQVFIGAYYHHVVESLTRLIHIREENISLLSSAHFHVGSMANWATEWAAMWGIPDDKLIIGIVSADTIVVPQSNYCGVLIGRYAKKARLFLHDQVQANMHGNKAQAFLQNHNLSPLSATTVLLIKRIHTRVVTNHAEVLELIKSFGYSVTEFVEGMEGDIYSQCKQFADADVVIGPHGAALSNLLCAKPDAFVIEFQESPHNNCMEVMTHEMGLDYRGIATDIEHVTSGNVSISAIREALRAHYLSA